jgi:predicted MPP superfamily phosphohydrolase
MGDIGALKAVALGLAFVTGLGVVGGVGFGLHWLGLRRLSRPERRSCLAFVVLLLGQVGAFGWGLIEAGWLEESHLELKTTGLPPGARLRVVHFTDLHVSTEASPLLEQLAERINALEPHLVVYTGDTLNEREGLPAARRLFSRIRARHGLFAVRGNQDGWFPEGEDPFGGAVTELKGRPVHLPEIGVTLCGDAMSNGGSLVGCLRAVGGGLRIVAYHSPDLVEELAPSGPDLYLAGHTHGGQVRLPFWGAVVTMSEFGKRYEMGLYRVGRTALYVSRGIGTEGGSAPPVRFLCRPELVVIDLEGEG